MRKFDYSFLKNIMLPPFLFNIGTSIYKLKERVESKKEGSEEIFSSLEGLAKFESVKSSNALEGIVTTDKRFKEMLTGITAPLNHNEMEILGYRDALDIIHNNYKKLSFSEETILSLYKTMFRYTNENILGKYKEEDNLIIGIDNFGRKNVRFKPISKEDTPEAMKELVLSYEEASSDFSINKLLLIPCVILDFLCIHPFEDGNGRMSRLLSLLLLYKNDFTAGKYISFEEQINKNKASYYESLKEASLNWDTGKNDYIPFIQNFLFTLLVCYKELDKRFNYKSENNNKTNRIRASLKESMIPLSKQDILFLFPDISKTMVEYVLSSLLKDGEIEKIGNGKNTKYFKK